jgi:hypothetical protein
MACRGKEGPDEVASIQRFITIRQFAFPLPFSSSIDIVNGIKVQIRVRCRVP